MPAQANALLIVVMALLGSTMLHPVFMIRYPKVLVPVIWNTPWTVVLLAVTVLKVRPPPAKTIIPVAAMMFARTTMLQAFFVNVRLVVVPVFHTDVALATAPPTVNVVPRSRLRASAPALLNMLAVVAKPLQSNTPLVTVSMAPVPALTSRLSCCCIVPPTPLIRIAQNFWPPHVIAAVPEVLENVTSDVVDAGV